MPPRGTRDDKLETQMLGLLKPRGYFMARFYITDKDWSLQRMAGGEGAVQGRYIAAAAAYKDGDGHFYSGVKFPQLRRSDGSWGPLQMMQIRSAAADSQGEHSQVTGTVASRASLRWRYAGTRASGTTTRRLGDLAFRLAPPAQMLRSAACWVVGPEADSLPRRLRAGGILVFHGPIDDFLE